jgi:hypothetical protein
LTSFTTQFTTTAPQKHHGYKQLSAKKPSKSSLSGGRKKYASKRKKQLMQ